MVCSEVPHSQAISAVSASSPIYSSWFCCGPYPCGVCWGTSTASTQIYGQVLICSLVGIGSFATVGVALQFVVPPTMLALLFEEAVTVAGLHGGSSSLISGGLGLVGGYDRDGECHQLASCVQSCWTSYIVLYRVITPFWLSTNGMNNAMMKKEILHVFNLRLIIISNDAWWWLMMIMTIMSTEIGVVMWWCSPIMKMTIKWMIVMLMTCWWQSVFHFHFSVFILSIEADLFTFQGFQAL